MYAPCLLLIIALHFTYGERKICSKTKVSKYYDHNCRLCCVQNTKRTSYSYSKAVTDQGHITEKLMIKNHNFYLAQNVDQTVHELKVAFAVAVYFTIALSLIVKTESCYQFYLRTPLLGLITNYWKDLDDYQENQECFWFFTDRLIKLIFLVLSN